MVKVTGELDSDLSLDLKYSPQSFDNCLILVLLVCLAIRLENLSNSIDLVVNVYCKFYEQFVRICSTNPPFLYKY
jgi:hypothetical protein